jgi:hypothetical protein
MKNAALSENAGGPGRLYVEPSGGMSQRFDDGPSARKRPRCTRILANRNTAITATTIMIALPIDERTP